MQIQKQKNPRKDIDFTEVAVAAVVGGLLGLAVDKSSGSGAQRGGSAETMAVSVIGSLLKVGGPVTVLGVLVGGVAGEEFDPEDDYQGEYSIPGDNLQLAEDI